MAKPIQFTTSVQSLGREDVGAPGRVAAAEIGAVDAAVEGVQQIERAVAATQYTKQMSDARNSINELYDSVVSKEMYLSSEVPEYITGFERYETVVGPDGQEIVQERNIPASEIREQWFRQGMQNIINAAVKGSTAPTARKRVSAELRTSIGPAAYNQLLTYNRAAAKKERLAILDSAVQKGIVDGDRLGVEATLVRGLASGEISRADYETRQLNASQDLDIEAYSQEVFNARDEADLEELYSQLGDNQSLTMPGESDMTPEQRRYLRQSIDRQEAVFDEQRKERYNENDQEAMSKFLGGSLTEGWLREMAITDGMDGGTIRAVLNMLNAGSRGDSPRENIMAPFRRQIQRSMYSPEFGTQVSDIVRDTRTQLMKSDVLNPIEVDNLIQYAEKIENDLRATPEIKSAVTLIRTIAGLPEDPTAIVNLPYSQDTIRARELNARFQKALYSYIDEFGAEAKPLEFVERNKKVYEFTEVDEDVDPIRTRVENSRFKGYAATPLFNPDMTMRGAFSDYNRGSLSDEDMFDLWNMMYGDAIDIDLLENL